MDLGKYFSTDTPLELVEGYNEVTIALGDLGKDGYYKAIIECAGRMYTWHLSVAPAAAEHVEIAGQDTMTNVAGASDEGASFKLWVDKGWTPTVSDERFVLWTPDPDLNNSWDGVPEGKVLWRANVNEKEDLSAVIGMQEGQQYTIRASKLSNQVLLDLVPGREEHKWSDQIMEGEDYKLRFKVLSTSQPALANNHPEEAEFTLIPPTQLGSNEYMEWDFIIKNVQRPYSFYVELAKEQFTPETAMITLENVLNSQMEIKLANGDQRFILGHFPALIGYPIRISLDVPEGYQPVIESGTGAGGSFVQRDGSTIWDYQIEEVKEDITFKIRPEKYAGVAVTANVTGTETRLSLPDGGSFPLTKSVASGSACEFTVIAQEGYQPAVHSVEGIAASQVTFRQGTEPNTWICRIENVAEPVTLTLKSVQAEQETGVTLELKEGEDRITLPDGGSFPLTVPVESGDSYTISLRVEEGFVPAVYHAEGVASTSVFFTQDEDDKTLWSYTLKLIDRRIALTLCAAEAPEATVTIDVAADTQDYISELESKNITVKKGEDAKFSFLIEEGWIPNTDELAAIFETDGDPDADGQTRWLGTIPAVRQDMTVTLTAEPAPKEPDLEVPPAEVDEDGKAVTEVTVTDKETGEEITDSEAIQDAVQEIIDGMDEEDDTFVTGTTETEPGADEPTAAEVTIPSAVVETIAKAENLTLEIRTPIGTIRIPAGSVSVIAPSDADKIILEIGPNPDVAKENEEEILEAFNIDFKKVTQDEETETVEKEPLPVEEAVEVSVKTNLKPTTGKGLLAFLVEEAKNTAEQVRSVVQRGIMPRNGFASFRVPHLSIYALCDATNAGKLGLPDGIEIKLTAGSVSRTLETSDFKGADNVYTLSDSVSADSLRITADGTDDEYFFWNATTAEDSANGAVSLQEGENIIGIRIEGIEYQLIVTRKKSGGGETPSLPPSGGGNTGSDNSGSSNNSNNSSSSDRTGGGASSKYKPIFSTNEVPTPNTPETANQGWRTPSYYDIPNNEWYYNAVMYVSREGMMAGNNGYFSPNGLLTRGMMAQILYNLEKAPGGAAAAFPDVSASDWFANAAGWTASSGCMSGYSNGKFGPLDPITREQLAAILYRYAAFRGYRTDVSAELSGFVDGGAVSGWADSAMRWAVASGLLSGKSGGRLDPSGPATRAEIAQILMRFYTNIAG